LLGHYYFKLLTAISCKILCKFQLLSFFAHLKKAEIIFDARDFAQNVDLRLFVH